MFKVRETVEITIKPSGARLVGIVRHTDGHHLLIACAQEESSQIQPGTQVELVKACEGDGLYLLMTTVAACFQGGFRVPLTTPQYIQRRRQPRVPCDLPARYRPQGSPGKMKTARVGNISLGGAKVYVGGPLPTDTFVELEIQLSAEERIGATAQVVRCLPLEAPISGESGELAYALALKFTEIARVDQMLIQRFMQAQSIPIEAAGRRPR
ncbi:MAG TPA: PilZ domain-containing protein [Chthonomonadaceae bacterium]|nr:PilZ domain-containing protein [Chthonomonadaceae bacterium]